MMNFTHSICAIRLRDEFHFRGWTPRPTAAGNLARKTDFDKEYNATAGLTRAGIAAEERMALRA